MKKILIPIIAMFIASCNTETKSNDQGKMDADTLSINTKVDNEYIEYLNNYTAGDDKKIDFETIEGITYWITHYHGSGTSSEYYWKLRGTQLIPMFYFEYGGMNWDKELSYTFKNIELNKTIEGHVYGDCEKKIEEEKLKFISKKDGTTTTSNINVKLFFKGALVEDLSKSEVNEALGFQKNKSHTFCYDTQVFDNLKIEGDVKNISIIVLEDSETIFKKENQEVVGEKIFTSKDFELGGGGQIYTIKILQGDLLLFEGKVNSEGCH